MTLHPQVEQLIGLKRESGPPLRERTVEDARTLTQMFAAALGDGPEIREVADIAIPSGSHLIPARIYSPDGQPNATIVYFHGGGWVLGTLQDSDCFCRVLTKASGCRVVSVGYRLAPEHPFPAAIEDCCTALAWIAGGIGKQGAIIVAGDSAGGNLAAAVAQISRDHCGPAIDLQLLVYPVTGTDLETPSYRAFGTDLFLEADDMRWFLDHYEPRWSASNDPLLAPIKGDLSRLPAAIVVLAEYDPLRDDGLAYANGLIAADIPVCVQMYGDMSHGFFTMVQFLDTAMVAVEAASAEIAAFLNDRAVAAGNWKSGHHAAGIVNKEARNTSVRTS